MTNNTPGNGAVPLGKDSILAMMAPEIVKQFIEEAKAADTLTDLDSSVEQLTRRVSSIIVGEKTNVTICVLWTLLKYLLIQNLPEVKNADNPS
jgi:hypothetical protein